VDEGSPRLALLLPSFDRWDSLHALPVVKTTVGERNRVASVGDSLESPCQIFSVSDNTGGLTLL
jgi:hypothetical protein